MRSRFILLTAAAALLAVPVGAEPQAQKGDQQAAPKPDENTKPINQRDPKAVDVVATPITDLNIRKGEIPQALIDAQAAPYSLAGLRRCNQIAAEVTRLDSVLGDDIDIAQEQGRHVSAGKVAQSVIGGFIPFRGIIREISGANEQERKVQAAIYAGSVRRSFLKGVGLQRGCPWPARSATPAMLSRIARDSAAKADEADQKKAAAASDRHRR